MLIDCKGSRFLFLFVCLFVVSGIWKHRKLVFKKESFHFGTTVCL